jgi:hypothetical protein
LTRKAIPKPTRDSVLKEFNHRCAICGTDKPQIHHIDEDPSNNDPLNLIPLCPNCHLLDQHAPTVPINPTKLQLFRRFKDPTILASQFEPLFRRIVFLIDLDEPSFNVKDYVAEAEELVSFVSALEMGEFYGKKIARLIEKPKHARVWDADTPSYVHQRWRQQEHQEYFKILSQNREQVIALVIELLRYQR